MAFQVQKHHVGKGEGGVFSSSFTCCQRAALSSSVKFSHQSFTPAQQVPGGFLQNHPVWSSTRQFPAMAGARWQQAAVLLQASSSAGREVSLPLRDPEGAAQSGKVQFGVKFPEIAHCCRRQRRDLILRLWGGGVWAWVSTVAAVPVTEHPRASVRAQQGETCTPSKKDGASQGPAVDHGSALCHASQAAVCLRR